MSTYTKATLLEMNSKIGCKWIINIDNIKNTELAKIYPTGSFNMSAGKLYVALPANLVITDTIKKQYNIFL
jgi:hypothetical protein